MGWYCKRTFSLNLWANTLTVRCIGLWNSVPRGVVEVLSLESFGARDDKTLTRKGTIVFALLYHQCLYYCNARLLIHCRGSRGKTNIIVNSKERRNIMAKCVLVLKMFSFPSLPVQNSSLHSHT